MIPDEQQWTPGPGPYRDADGCRLFPGQFGWVSDDDGLAGDGRSLHVPITLGDVGQFQLAWDCHVLEEGDDIEEEEELLVALSADPLVGALARDLLDGLPAEEIALEADFEGPLDRFRGGM